VVTDCDAGLARRTGGEEPLSAPTTRGCVSELCIVEEVPALLVFLLPGIALRFHPRLALPAHAGWLCSQLTPFGQVTGTDLSDDVLSRAAQRMPEVRFIAGDFMSLEFGTASNDVAICLEVLSHVQEAFLAKISTLLRLGGYLMLATQNKPALLRNEVPPAGNGQLRHWVDRTELRSLLEQRFEVDEMFSITPQFNRGFLRILNSNRIARLNARVGLSGITTIMKQWQERMWLGWTLMALARKRPFPR
jgi:SAM-dependent methyltransferase